MKLKEVDLDRYQPKDDWKYKSCTAEMMRLFECYEKNDFSHQLCQQQSLALESCYTQHKKMKAITKANKAK